MKFQEGHSYGVRFERGNKCAFKHGYASVRRGRSWAYRSLDDAYQRCTNPNKASYKNYGGRGIMFNFLSLADGTKWLIDNIGDRPSKAYTLDRINNDSHYEPGNLRWATRKEQSCNQRKRNRQTPVGNEVSLPAM